MDEAVHLMKLKLFRFSWYNVISGENRGFIMCQFSKPAKLKSLSLPVEKYICYFFIQSHQSKCLTPDALDDSVDRFKSNAQQITAF